MPTEHSQVTQHEFTKQAAALANSGLHRDQALLATLMEFSRVTPRERVLDAACGPGLVVEAFLPHARAVVGIDLTRAMLAQARGRVSASTASWVQGELESLPLRTGGFDLIVSRFAVHHLHHPLTAMREMARVARLRGRIAVMDHASSDDPAQATYQDRIEVWRDPSHVHSHSRAELRALLESAGLRLLNERQTRLEMDFEEWSARTFQSAERVEQARRLLLDSIAIDRSGLGVRLEQGRIRFSYTGLLMLAQTV